MKNYILYFVLLTQFLITCKAQEKFNDKTLFLGEYNDKNELKVIQNDSILFIDKTLLKQTKQITAKDFIKILDSLDLYFIAEGDEPFWKIKLNSSELFLSKYDSEKEEHFSIKTYVDKQSEFNMMFKSDDNKLFGLIRRIDFRLNKKDACSLCLSDNHLVYEVFITVDNEVYKGCGMIDK